MTPYSKDTVRSVYHVRNLEVFRVRQVTSTRENPVDIFLSHDWPRGVTNYGDSDELCRKKRFFTQEVQSNSLGSRAAEEMLDSLRPRYWFSGHLHVKFEALVEHKDDERDSLPSTKFLALDKCLAKRDFLQILDIKPNHRMVSGENLSNKVKLSDSHEVDIYDEEGTLNIYHDLEWLTILRLTNHLINITSNYAYMPGPGSSDERYDFKPSKEEMKETLEMMNNDLLIKPSMFTRTAKSYDTLEEPNLKKMELVSFPQAVMNPYTVQLCEKIGLDDPIFSLKNKGKGFRSLHDSPKRKPSAKEMDVTLDANLANDTYVEVSVCILRSFY